MHGARIPQHRVARTAPNEVGRVGRGEHGVVGWDHQKLLRVRGARVVAVDASGDLFVALPRAWHNNEAPRRLGLVEERRERLHRLPPGTSLGILVGVEPALCHVPLRIFDARRWKHAEALEGC